MNTSIIKPLRILQMIGSLRMGGSQSMIINLYKNIDRTKIQFDFILDHNDEIDLKLVPIVKELGSNIFFLPTFKGCNIVEVIKSWHKFFKFHPEYKIIHSHVRSYASIFLSIAKMHGLKTIIHSHSVTEGKGILSFVKRALEYPLRFIADYFFACSNEAGKWLFGDRIVKNNNFEIIPNGIDIDLYKFNQEIRKKYRSKLQINEKTKVYIHVGRFHESKNHKFLLSLFSEIVKRNKNFVLLLVGDGELRSQIEDQIKKLSLKNNVKLLGVQSNINCWLQASDCMLFPSLWEGLGMVAIEAQASGLPCVCSEYVPKIVSVSNNCKFLPLKEELWVKEILNMDFTRGNNINAIKNAGFDIKETASFITTFYQRLSHD